MSQDTNPCTPGDMSSLGLGSAKPVSSPKPSQIVLALCQPLPESVGKVYHRNGNVSMATFLSVKCPSGNKCDKPDGVIKWQKGVGWSNPLQHLVTCCFGGSKASCESAYRQKVMSAPGTINFPIIAKKDMRSVAMEHWINLIVFKNIPIEWVEDEHMRAFSKFDTNFSVDFTTKVMLEMVQLTEAIIGKQMKSAGIGAILYDGWTKDSIHYIALLASYMRVPSVFKDKKFIGGKPELEIVLLSLAPMMRHKDTVDHEDKDDDAISELATKFDSDAQAEYIHAMLDYYGVTVEEWVACQIADNAKVNHATAEKLKIPHVGCKNHMLNHEVNNMMEETDPDLGETIDDIQDVFKSLKTIKNTASLKAYTNLRPTLYCPTRWSGKFKVVRKFLKLREFMVAMHRNPDSDFYFPDHLRSADFTDTVKGYKKMLGAIDEVTKALQERGVTLSTAQGLLDSLIEKVKEGNAAPVSANHFLKHCTLGEKWISHSSRKITHKDFNNGVIKIQLGKSNTLTQNEKNAVQKLLKHGVQPVQEMSDDEEGNSIVAIFNKKRRIELSEVGEYVNCDFILGSAAEVERVWSRAELILTKKRFRLAPIVLEAVMFLKLNYKHWDKNTVALAMRNVSSQLAQDRYVKYQKYMDQMADLTLVDEE